MAWSRRHNGYYTKTRGLCVAHIERSEHGFWWWIVVNVKTGETYKADRVLALKIAKKEADLEMIKPRLKAV